MAFAYDISVDFDPVDLAIDYFEAEMLSPEAQARMLVDFANDNLRQAIDLNQRVLGHPVLFHILVGAVVLAALTYSAVRSPDERIEIEFEIEDDVLLSIDRDLKRLSPRRSGRYQQSHTWFADGRQFDIESAIPAAKEYVVFSSVPYARKIERGFSRQADRGVYQVVAAAAEDHYGAIADVRYVFREAPFSYQGAGKSRRSWRRGRDRNWFARQPAISVVLKVA